MFLRFIAFHIFPPFSKMKNAT